MNELLLVIIFIIVIILVQNYNVNRSNSAYYIRLISGIVFLPFIWLAAEADKLPIKMLLTLVVLSAINKAYLKFYNEKITGPNLNN